MTARRACPECGADVAVRGAESRIAEHGDARIRGRKRERGRLLNPCPASGRVWILGDPPERPADRLEDPTLCGECSDPTCDGCDRADLEVLGSGGGRSRSRRRPLWRPRRRLFRLQRGGRGPGSRRAARGANSTCTIRRRKRSGRRSSDGRR